MSGAGDTESVTVIRPAGRDAYGDETGEATEIVVAGCLFAPGPSREPEFLALQVVTDGTVYAPPGTHIEPTDRIDVRGDLYTVVGHPQAWGSFGVVIGLRRYTG